MHIVIFFISRNTALRTGWQLLPSSMIHREIGIGAGLGSIPYTNTSNAALIRVSTVSENVVSLNVRPNARKEYIPL